MGNFELTYFVCSQQVSDGGGHSADVQHPRREALCRRQRQERRQARPHGPARGGTAGSALVLYTLTKNRPENCGQRASLAVLGCLGLEQQNSWNLALQNVEQLKWILSQTGGDGEETNHSCPPLSPAPSCA